MAVGGTLKSTHEIQEIKIQSSTQISGKTTAIITKLTAVPASDSKSPIVALRAQAKSANKLISIVEISKRQLKAKGVELYQYTALSSELIEIERAERTAADDQRSDKAEDSDDAFESVVKLAARKKRAVPVVTIYLSNRPVKELRAEYDEQTD